LTVAWSAFALLGFLSPANRGSLMTAMVVLLIVMGYALHEAFTTVGLNLIANNFVHGAPLHRVLNGYFACRTYKMFKGVHWKRCTLLVRNMVSQDSHFFVDFSRWCPRTSIFAQAMFLYPGVAFGIFLVINFLISGQHSSGTPALLPSATHLVHVS
jgi:transmembrane 9 superfamily protein 2/4